MTYGEVRSGMTLEITGDRWKVVAVVTPHNDAQARVLHVRRKAAPTDPLTAFKGHVTEEIPA